MNLISLETAGETCSVALRWQGELLEQFELAPRRQTERVLPMVASLLAEAGVALSQLDGVVFGRGPGAFTGVRIAVSVAQALGFAMDRPVLGVSTLASAALAAMDAGADGPVLIAFDARMGELYLAVYQAVDGPQLLQPLLADALVAPAQLPALPAGLRCATGSGQALEPALSEALGQRLHWIGDGHPRAGTLLRLALSDFAEAAVPAREARPVYLRDQIVQGGQQ